ncbi:hypothetical protein VTN00DRAFT_4064 [Thermoascus crustaceus]|uniref:uncharacterized protein n=1 Tax=Thermoascus crustaceus TaxID=5088 RepID=UPI0037448BAA
MGIPGTSLSDANKPGEDEEHEGQSLLSGGPEATGALRCPPAAPERTRGHFSPGFAATVRRARRSVWNRFEPDILIAWPYSQSGHDSRCSLAVFVVLVLLQRDAGYAPDVDSDSDFENGEDGPILPEAEDYPEADLLPTDTHIMIRVEHTVQFARLSVPLRTVVGFESEAHEMVELEAKHMDEEPTEDSEKTDKSDSEDMEDSEYSETEEVIF